MKIVETDDNQINITISTGVKGDTGKSLTFADLTADEINELKGPKGDKGDDGVGLDPKQLQDTFARYGCYTEGANAYEMLAKVFLGLTTSNPFLSEVEFHNMGVDNFCRTAIENQVPVAHLSIPGWYYYSINDEEPIQAISKSGDKIDYNYLYETINLDQNAQTFSLKVYKPNKELVKTFTIPVPEVTHAPETMPAPAYPSYGMIEKVYPEEQLPNHTTRTAADYNNLINFTSIVFFDITHYFDQPGAVSIDLNVSGASHQYVINKVVVYSTKKFKADSIEFSINEVPSGVVEYANRELLPSTITFDE